MIKLIEIIRLSVREIKEIVGCVVVLSHGVTSCNVVDQSWSPCKSDPFFVEMVNEPSVNNVFLEASIHEMEVNVLVAW